MRWLAERFHGRHRSFAWAMAWGVAVQFATDRLWGWPWWAQTLIALPTVAVVIEMTDRHSLRWRWLLLRHWDALQRPLVFNEDNDVVGLILPFETVHVMGDADGPHWGHVHSRTLIRGRHRLRAETRWR